MRVGLDISPITPDRTGIGTYCYNLLKHLVRLAPEVSFVGFRSGRSRPRTGDLPSPMPVRYVPVPTRLLYATWECTRRPRVDRLLGGLDVFHATNYFLPPVESARRVLSIYDLSFLVRPELCSPKIVRPFSKGIRHFARDADAVIACSESTKQDIVRFLNVDAAKITVAPGAVDEGFTPVPREEAAALLARRYGIRTPFLLFVSTLEPRKNVDTLLRSFVRLVGEQPHCLVLVGPVGWKARGLFRTIEMLRLGPRVVRPGYVPPKDLPAFYSAADAFVLPTRYEGFGLPLLEAMHCGCPVVTSNNSAVPEVVGDAALQVDAEDIEGLASAISRVLVDDPLRERLSSLGRQQARRFSWMRTAEQVLKTYRSVASCSSC